MDAICNLVELTQTMVSARLGLTFLKRSWGTLLEWRERCRLRARLYDLSDRELHDIGTTRGEIDYVASNRSIDPRGVRSAEWVQYLPTVDGQIVQFQTTKTQKSTSDRVIRGHYRRPHDVRVGSRGPIGDIAFYSIPPRRWRVALAARRDRAPSRS